MPIRPLPIISWAAPIAPPCPSCCPRTTAAGTRTCSPRLSGRTGQRRKPCSPPGPRARCTGPRAQNISWPPDRPRSTSIPWCSGSRPIPPCRKPNRSPRWRPGVAPWPCRLCRWHRRCISSPTRRAAPAHAALPMARCPRRLPPGSTTRSRPMTSSGRACCSTAWTPRSAPRHGANGGKRSLGPITSTIRMPMHWRWP